MSYTTVRGVWPGEKLQDIRELPNAWLSAPVVWVALGQKYLGWQSSADMVSKDKCEKLWPLYQDDTIPLWHRAILLMTYDGAHVLKADFRRAANDLLSCNDLIDTFATSHWITILDIFLTPPDVPAIGFIMNSISDDPLSDGSKIDWSKAYNLYAELDKYPPRDAA